MENQIGIVSPNPVNQTQFTANPSSVANQDEPTPSGVKIVSITFFLLATLYLLSTLVFFALNLILNYIASFGWGYFVFDFLRYFPTTGLPPILLSIATFIYFLTAIKIRDRSRLSWALGLVCLIVIPFPLAIANRLLFISPIHNAFNRGNDSVQTVVSVQSFQSVASGINFVDLFTTGIMLVSLVILIIKIKSFNQPGNPLSTKAKFFLGAIIFFLIIPIVSAMSYGYYTTTDQDRGFAEIQKQTNFHIYRPNYIPKDFVLWGRPKQVNDAFGGKGAIIFVYGPPLYNASEPGVLTITQEQIDPNFDVGKFVNSQVKDPQKEVVKQISLPQAKSGKGYTRQVTEKSYWLYYIDPNNMLFRILFEALDQNETTKTIDSLQ